MHHFFSPPKVSWLFILWYLSFQMKLRSSLLNLCFKNLRVLMAVSLNFWINLGRINFFFTKSNVSVLSAFLPGFQSIIANWICNSHTLFTFWDILVVVLVASPHSYYFCYILGLMPCINYTILQAFYWVRPRFYFPLLLPAARRSWSFPFLCELVKEVDIQGQMKDMMKYTFIMPCKPSLLVVNLKMNLHDIFCNGKIMVKKSKGSKAFKIH